MSNSRPGIKCCDWCFFRTLPEEWDLLQGRLGDWCTLPPCRDEKWLVGVEILQDCRKWHVQEAGSEAGKWRRNVESGNGYL